MTGQPIGSRRDHAVELPAGDDHAQGGASDRRRLHRGGHCRADPDAADRAGARRCWPNFAGVLPGVFNVVTGDPSRSAAS